VLQGQRAAVAGLYERIGRCFLEFQSNGLGPLIGRKYLPAWEILQSTLPPRLPQMLLHLGFHRPGATCGPRRDTNRRGAPRGPRLRAFLRPSRSTDGYGQSRPWLPLARAAAPPSAEARAAKAEPAHLHLFDAERIHQRQHVPGYLLGCQSSGWIRRVAMAAQVGNDQIVPGGERLDMRAPDSPRVGQAVDEEERCPLPRPAVVLD